MSNIPLRALAAALQPVSLDTLNSKAAMLERIDQKYVVSAATLYDAVDSLGERFDVLQIDGRRSFTYDTAYYDTHDFRAYNHHHQGRRKRCKVRVRRYSEAGIAFVEVKLKDLRDMTVKKRFPTDPEMFPLLDETCRAQVDTAHEHQYGEPLGGSLHEVLQMTYRRTTFVARDGGERMTIDDSLGLWSKAGFARVTPGLCIVETKSANGSGIADVILRSHGVRAVKSCSKYCVGLAALGHVSRVNRFLPAMRKLGLADGYWR